MLLERDMKTIAKYAERRKICITPNEAKRLGGERIHSPSGNSVGVQPAAGLRESILFTSLYPLHPQSLRFIGGYAHSTLRVSPVLINFF